MKSINLSGSSRGNVGKSDANQLRAEGKIPRIVRWKWANPFLGLCLRPQISTLHARDLQSHSRHWWHQTRGNHCGGPSSTHYQKQFCVDFLNYLPTKVRLDFQLSSWARRGVRAGGKFTARMPAQSKGLPSKLPANGRHQHTRTW